MTAKEKAEAIIKRNWECYPKYEIGTGLPDYRIAKLYALACLEEMLDLNGTFRYYHERAANETDEFLNEVKKEVKKYE